MRNLVRNSVEFGQKGCGEETWLPCVRLSLSVCETVLASPVLRVTERFW